MTALFVGSFDAGDSDSGTLLDVEVTYEEGEHVFIRCTRGSAGTTETVTDGTNVYTQIGSSVTAGSGDIVTHYECVSTVAGTFTVTQTLGTAAAFRGIQGMRYTGLSGWSIHVGQSQSGIGTGIDAVTSGNLTPTSQPGLLIGWHYDFNNGGAAVAGTGFTSRATFPTEAAANGSASRAEDKRLTSAAAVAATFTLTGATGALVTSAIWCAEKSRTALDFGGGSATNPSRHYTYAFPGLPDGDWCIGCWITPLVAPSVSPGSTIVLHSSPLPATTNPGVMGYIDFASTPINLFSIYAGGSGWSPAAGPFLGSAPSFNTTPVLVIIQRRAGVKQWYWAVKGSNPVAPDATAAFTGTTIAAGTGLIGAFAGPAFRFTLPLGEFFLFNNRSLSASEVALLASGLRPSASTIGANPLILFGFRDGPQDVEPNLGSGGATYNANRVGTGFTTTTEFFELPSGVLAPVPKMRTVYERLPRGGDDVWDQAQANVILANDVFDNVAASSGFAKAWNGSSWVSKPVKYWNGSSWVTKPMKRWNDSSWV